MSEALTDLKILEERGAMEMEKPEAKASAEGVEVAESDIDTEAAEDAGSSNDIYEMILKKQGETGDLKGTFHWELLVSW